MFTFKSRKPVAGLAIFRLRCQIFLVLCFIASTAEFTLAAPPWNFTNQSPTWPPPTGHMSFVTSIPLEARAVESPVGIELRFFVAGTYAIFRKLEGTSDWGTAIATGVNVGPGGNWTDSTIVQGTMYDYRVTLASPNRAGYVLAGVKVDQTQPRGHLALVVAEDIPANLPEEYAQYKSDLVSEGWEVHEISTPRAKDYLSNATGTNMLATVTVTNGGTAYVNNAQVLLTSGTATAVAQLRATVTPGPITSIVVNYSGGGFAPGQTLTMSGSTAGSGAVLTVGAVVSGTAEHINIRNQILDLYDEYPGELKNVIVLGKVAVPRAGTAYIGPDGHGNRSAVGTDAYYADMDVTWTDTGNNLHWYTIGAARSNAITSGTLNVPGDNKFDKEVLSQVGGNKSVEMGFGRIDFSNNVPGEYAAMRMYFNKLHRYKTASPDFLPGRRAALRAFYEPVSLNALQSMPGVVGMNNLDFVRYEDLPPVPSEFSTISNPDIEYDRDAAYTAGPQGPYLFYFKGSVNPGYSDGGKAVFWTGLQSHWGYWFEPTVTSGQNRMQRRLAEDNFTLSFTWSIFGSWYLYQRMGLGFDAGDMMRFSISDKTWALNYQPITQSQALSMAHMGCPTLRLFMFAPPTSLIITQSGGNPQLSWTASRNPPAGEPQILGYHVYRSSTPEGPYVRLTEEPVAGTAYTDTAADAGEWHYSVRAVRLETTGAGSYYNASLGAQRSIDLTNGPAPLSIATTSLPEARWNNAYQTKLVATGGTPIFNWAITEGALPPGLTLSPSGVISGHPEAQGTYAFTVEATDQLGQTADKSLSLSTQSNSATTLFAEAGSYVSVFNTTKWSNWEPSLLLSGTPYLYEPFLRFNLASLTTNNSFVKAKLILTLDGLSQPGSYALVRAALTQDVAETWTDWTLTYATRPLDDGNIAAVSANNFPSAYGTIEFDVTSLVQRTLVNDPAKKLGLRLFTTLGNAFGNEVRIATRFASGNARPRLVIETTNAPLLEIQSPTINPASLHVGSSLVIQATAAAIPANAGALTVAWSKVSGPGDVAFTTTSTPSTAVSFSAAGDYVLRLSANDGVLTSTKDLTVRVLSVAAATAPTTGPTASLIMRLPFDEGVGAVTADVTGNNNNGTLGTIGGTGNPTRVGGKVGGAINFNGAGQRVEINDSPTTPLDGMQKLTAAFWIKLNGDSAAAQALLVKRTTTTTSTTSYAITLTSAEKLSVSVANKTAVLGDNILAIGTWYHVAMIYDGSLATNNLQLYLNGNPEKFGTITTGEPDNKIPRIPASKLRVGDHTATAVTASFNGAIDEVRLYNRALSLEELQDLVQAAPANMGPQITMGAPVNGTVGEAIGIGASVSDDGLPGPLTLQWESVGGPGALVFGNESLANTTITAGTAGDYTLRLLANDGSITTWKNLLAVVTGSALNAGYVAWLEANNLPTDGSGLGAPNVSAMGDGVANAIKYALGLDADAAGYAGRLSTEVLEVAGADYLSLTYVIPDPALTGVGYTVKVGDDLADWSADVTVVSNTLETGLRTITVRDNQPINAGHPKRFIRLEVNLE